MNIQRLTKIILAPVVSEKSNRMAEQGTHIALKVLPGATKKEIKAAVETLFEVKVDSVTTVMIKGKAKRFGRYAGKRSNVKKAYVKLAEGQNLDLESAAVKAAE